MDHNSLSASIQPIIHLPCEAEVLEGPQLGLTLSSLLQSESDNDWALLGTSTTPHILGLWQQVNVSLNTALGTSQLYKTTPGFRGREDLHTCTPEIPTGTNRCHQTLQEHSGTMWTLLLEEALEKLFAFHMQYYPALASSGDTGSTLRVFTGRITKKQLFCSSSLSAIPQRRQVPKTKLSVTTDKCHTSFNLICLICLLLTKHILTLASPFYLKCCLQHYVIKPHSTTVIRVTCSLENLHGKQNPGRWKMWTSVFSHTFCGCAGLLHILCLLGSGTAVMAAAKATHMHIGECLKFNPHHEIFSQNMPYQTELLKHL